MTPRSTILALLTAAVTVAFGLQPPVLAAGPAPRGLVTEAEGGPTVLEASRREAAPTPRRLRTFDLLPPGSTVTLEPGQRLAVLCSTEHLVRLDGPARWHLAAETCRGGRRQPAGTFRGILPERGRLVRIGDVLSLEMTTRGDEDRAVPVLLAPRDTALLDPAPEVVWTAVPGALEYEVEAVSLGSMGSESLALEPGEARCGNPRADWPGVEVCSLSWSALAPSGEPPTGTVYLGVGARFAMGAPLREEQHSPRVRWLSGERRTEAEERFRGLAAPGDDPFLHAVLEARTAIELDLYERARQRLLDALALREAPAVRVTLGDLYMEITLPELAAPSYRRAAEEATDPAVRGTAAYGLGRASYARSLYEPAREHFRRAAGLFGHAGLTDERAAATRAAAKAAERSR